MAKRKYFCMASVKLVGVQVLLNGSMSGFPFFLILTCEVFLQEIISTLDLVSGDQIEFLLIIPPGDKSYRLAHAAFKVAKEFNVSVKVCVLWPAGAVKGIEAGSKAALTPWENYVDVVEVKKSPASPSWWDICQMTEKGAILVRPDEHIAWRSMSGVVGDHIVEIEMVFSAILGKK